MFPDELEEVRIEGLEEKVGLLEESMTRIERDSNRLLAKNAILVQALERIIELESNPDTEPKSGALEIAQAAMEAFLANYR